VNVWYDTAKNWRILSNISGFTGPIFAIFSPYESALGADDGSVLIFQFVKGRCHGNQIMFGETSNEGGLIPRAFFARSPGGRTVMFATTC